MVLGCGPSPPRRLRQPGAGQPTRPAGLASAVTFRRVRTAYRDEEHAFSAIPNNAELSLVTTMPPRRSVAAGQVHTFGRTRPHPKDYPMNAQRQTRAEAPPWHLRTPPGLPAKFESAAAVEQEDRRRVTILRAGDQPLAEQLADMLAADDFHETEPTTMASSRFMRVARIRIINGAAALLEATLVMGRLYFVTIVLPAWFVPEDELHESDPKAMLRQLRAHLLRAGIGDSYGLIIGHLEAAYCRQKSTDKLGFAFHVHLVCDDAAAAVIERMRGIRSFKPSADVGQPLRIEALRDDDLRSVLGYCFMAFWRSRAIDEHPEGLDDVRRRAGGGLPSEAARREWVWRHNHSLADLSLVMGTRKLSRAFRHTWV